MFPEVRGHVSKVGTIDPMILAESLNLDPWEIVMACEALVNRGELTRSETDTGHYKVR